MLTNIERKYILTSDTNCGIYYTYKKRTKFRGTEKDKRLEDE
jgi:hypothetical protein